MLRRLKIPSWLSKLIFRLISIAALAVLFLMIFNQWENLRSYSWNIQPVPLLISFAFYGMASIISALVWGQMLDSLTQPLGWRNHLRVYLMSRMVSHLPGPLLHIPGRMFFYQGHISKTLISFASILELFFILAAGAIVSIAVGGQFQTSTSLFWSVIAIVLGMISIQPRVIHRVLRLFKIEVTGALRLRDSFFWLCGFILVWFLYGFSLYTMILGIFPTHIPALIQIISAWAISGLVATLSAFLPSSLGLRELTLGLLLVGSLPAGMEAVTAILNRFLWTLFDVILAGFVYGLIKPLKPVPLEDSLGTTKEKIRKTSQISS
jgi:uncharacterized membrane protein YbhN (UPF0104 family)